MKRLYLATLLLLSALVPCQLSARSLSPDEALTMAKSQSPQSAKMLKSASSQSFTLVYTQKSIDSDSNMAYVFADKANDGFLIVAADDDMPHLLLGYSDSSIFDPNNIPPAMKWWLEMCASTVQQAIIDSANPMRVVNTGYTTYSQAQEKPSRLRVPAAARTDIAPIVKTKWGQDEPYNDLCPLVMGRRSVTGCVATAMAQVMKAHDWPASGVGSNSYRWSVNGTTYNASLDFSSINFDWSNMTDTYDASSTPESKNAVATLMYACGVGCNMTYSPNESGASDFNAAKALLNNFNYDQSMAYLERAWFTAEEWDNMLYDQLSKNMPVMFGGLDITNAGHEFVIDGYSADGFYHVNWGWDGYSDGYFSITDLNPYQQGTGGGSGESGFNYNQSMTINVQRPQEGSKFNPFMAMDSTPIATDVQRYDRNSYTGVYIKGGFYSYALRNCKFILGLHAKGNNIDEYIEWASGAQELSPLSGYSAYGIFASAFPVGTYEVTPAFRTPDGEWKEMYVDYSNPTKRLSVNVTESTIIVGEAQSEERGEVFGECLGYAPLDDNDGDKFYIGHSYIFRFDISSTGPWDGNTQVLLVKDGYFYAMSEVHPLEFNTADITTVDYTLDIPQNVEPGDYGLVLTYEEDDGYYAMSHTYAITVAEMQEKGTGTVSSVEFAGSQSSGTSQANPAVLYNDDLNISVTFSCTRAPWTEDITLCFADVNTYSIFYETQPLSVNMNQVGQTQTLTFSGPWEGVENNKTYLLAVFGSKSDQMSNIYYFRIEDKVIEVSSVSLSETESALKVGETIRLSAIVIPNDATDPSLTWTSSNEEVARIEVSDNYNIIVEAISEGTAIISATSVNGINAKCTITVSKKQQEITWATESQAILVGDEITLEASASSGLEVQYEITQGKDIASLSGNVLRVEGKGEVVVTASQPGNQEYAAAEPASITITGVKVDILPTGITLSETDVTLTIGESITIYATITPEDATDRSINWEFKDMEVAWVDGIGDNYVIIYGLSAGTAEVTATTSNGILATCTITVVKKQQSIAWETQTQEVPEGSDIELQAKASSGLDVTYEITEGNDIASLNGNVLHINAPGKVTILASQNGNDEFEAAEPVALSIYGISGIDWINADLDIKVIGNTVAISGINQHEIVAVYTVDGKCIYTGTDHTITLEPAQAYLLHVVGLTYKIYIK